MAAKKKKTAGKKSAGKKEQGELFEDVKLGKEDEDGFQDVYDPESGETMEFREEGDECEGIFYDSFVNEGGEYGDSHCYKVFDVNAEKTWLCWGTFVLNKHMAPVKPGTYVRITYRGKAGRAHNFKVGVSKKLTKQYAKVAGKLIEQAKGSDETVPF
jgi:hypothetical protein